MVGPASSPDNFASISGQHPDLSESIIHTNYRMPLLSGNFYSEVVQGILPCCGNEYSDKDYHSAVEFLNDKLNLRLDPIQIRVLGLLLTALSQARRFGGDVHMPQYLGENSAVHSCHTAILMNEVFRRAGLLEKETQTPEVLEKRVKATLACLVHDMGEILGEFSSLANRTDRPDIEEDPLIERKVYETMLRLAFIAVADNRATDFYRSLEEIRAKRQLIGTTEGERTLGALLDRYCQDELPDKIDGSFRAFMGLFDLSQLRDTGVVPKDQLFLGYLVAACEHTQGTRHYVRFSTHDEGYERLHIFTGHSPDNIREPQPEHNRELALTIPTSLCTSARIMKNFKYVEGEVGYLFAHAESGAEKALARVMRDTVYQTVAELIHSTSPVVDRQEKKQDPIVSELIKMIFDRSTGFEAQCTAIKVLRMYLEAMRKGLTERLQSQIENTPNYHQLSESQLFKIESSDRLVGLYLKAIRAGYEPASGEILALRDTLPPELVPLKPFDPLEFEFESVDLPLWRAAMGS